MDMNLKLGEENVLILKIFHCGVKREKMRTTIVKNGT